MRSPITALTWQIWRRNRGSGWVVPGIILFAWLFDATLPASLRKTESGRDLIGAIHGLVMASSLVTVFSIFNFTESNRGKEWTGFPYRLFVLPVPTLLLVTLPLALGVVCVGLVYAAWANLIFTHGEITDPWWFAV